MHERVKKAFSCKELTQAKHILDYHVDLRFTEASKAVTNITPFSIELKKLNFAIRPWISKTKASLP